MTKYDYCDCCGRKMQLQEIVKDDAIEVFYCKDCIINNEVQVIAK